MTDSNITICGHGSGNPSTKNLNTYSTQRYNQVASNGVHKGIVSVRRLKNLKTDGKRKKYVKTYKTILGRNIYSNDLRQYVYKPYSNGRYYSDCSSSQMATLEKIGVWSGSWYLNTEYIYKSDKFEDVPVKIKNGHITNPEVLKLGDQILFAGNDPNRPLQIGHVEGVYAIKKVEALRAAKPTLRKSDTGAEVEMLQRDLKALGYLGKDRKPLKLDGDFGSNTEHALKNFQREHVYVTGVIKKKAEPLEVDGIYGSKSAASMKLAIKAVK